MWTIRTVLFGCSNCFHLYWSYRLHCRRYFQALAGLGLRRGHSCGRLRLHSNFGAWQRRRRIPACRSRVQLDPSRRPVHILFGRAHLDHGRLDSHPHRRLSGWQGPIAQKLVDASIGTSKKLANFQQQQRKFFYINSYSFINKIYNSFVLFFFVLIIFFYYY